MRRTGSACLLLAVAVLAGCGGGGGGGGGKTVALKAGQPLAVTAREYKFDPKNVSVNAGGKPATLAIKLHNAGGLAHDFRVEKGGSEVGGTPIVLGDKDAGATVKLAPGSYTFFCSVGDHEQLGMKGTLTVR